VDLDADELGPIDDLVVEFAEGRSTISGEMAMELAALVDAGVIRLLDLVVVAKSRSGAIEAYEVDDLDPTDLLRPLGDGLPSILAAQDVVDLAAAVLPGSTAGVLVWENTWAAPLAGAARRSGGKLVASGRIPVRDDRRATRVRRREP
jgi:hypothetical protein